MVKLISKLAEFILKHKVCVSVCVCFFFNLFLSCAVTFFLAHYTFSFLRSKIELYMLESKEKTFALEYESALSSDLLQYVISNESNVVGVLVIN